MLPFHNVKPNRSNNTYSKKQGNRTRYFWIKNQNISVKSGNNDFLKMIVCRVTTYDFLFVNCYRNPAELKGAKLVYNFNYSYLVDTVR